MWFSFFPGVFFVLFLTSIQVLFICWFSCLYLFIRFRALFHSDKFRFFPTKDKSIDDIQSVIDSTTYRASFDFSMGVAVSSFFGLYENRTIFGGSSVWIYSLYMSSVCINIKNRQRNLIVSIAISEKTHTHNQTKTKFDAMDFISFRRVRIIKPDEYWKFNKRKKSKTISIMWWGKQNTYIPLALDWNISSNSCRVYLVESIWCVFVSYFFARNVVPSACGRWSYTNRKYQHLAYFHTFAWCDARLNKEISFAHCVVCQKLKRCLTTFQIR